MKATTTIRQVLNYKQSHASWFAATQSLFNQVASFYFEVIQAHQGILDLSSKDALTALEKLTHATAENPHPVMPLVEVQENIPSMFRRAAIHVALGAAHVFYTHLKKWHARKEKALAKGKRFTERPPVPPRAWNKSVTCYAGMYKGRTDNGIMLKVWTGTCWSWVKCHVTGRAIPEQGEAGSPSLVYRAGKWWLHTPVEQQVVKPAKVQEQVTTNTQTHICAVDLNMGEHIAVCTIQTVEGTTLATTFIGGGQRVSGFRKQLLGRIARNRARTGIVAEDEQDNAALWRKIRNVDEQVAHLVSRRIVDFAKEHKATILVFEHLGKLKPEKGKYSKRGNEKRAYWMKGHVFRYAKYKAWSEGIITSRVSPYRTSRECACCGAPVIRYCTGQPEEGYTVGAPLVYCPSCQMRGHADRNASLVIGKRLIQRYIKQEKPHTPQQCAERSVKAEGVLSAQEAESDVAPSMHIARHGTENGHGTAPREKRTRMGKASLSIPHQLRLPME